MSDWVPIGKTNPWRYRAGDPPINDLTRGSSSRITFQAEGAEVWIDPSISALVIVDMQNSFLSPALGRDPSGPGAAAMQALIPLVPALRDAGVQIIWCNWGVTEEDIDEMPAHLIKSFGYLNSLKSVNVEKDITTKPKRIYCGFGSDMGTVTVDGKEVQAGRLLMRDQWNSALPPPLEAVRDTHRDVWVHKNRMSGMWNPNTPLSLLLKERKLQTLLFAGVNTDQCVQGTLVDASNSGYDVVLVKDTTGTMTPHGQEVTEWNVRLAWGHVVSSEEVRRGVSASAKEGSAGEK